MFFLVWLLIVVGGLGLLWTTYKLVGPLFMEKFITYEVNWHEQNGFCRSKWCNPQKLTYKSVYSQFNEYSPIYGPKDNTNKEDRIRKCCINSAKIGCNNWLPSWWSIRNDMKAMSLFSSIDADRKELLALKKRDEKILEELRNSPEGSFDMAIWQKAYDIGSKEVS